MVLLLIYYNERNYNLDGKNREQNVLKQRKVSDFLKIKKGYFDIYF